MLHGHIRIRTFGLKRVRIAIERDCDRKLNVSKPSRTKGIHPALSVAKAFASDATLRRANRRSGKNFAPTDCNLDVRHLQFSANLSLQGKTTDALKRSVAGAASPYGGNLRLEIGDLDKRFSRHGSSHSFNLVDVGALPWRRRRIVSRRRASDWNPAGFCCAPGAGALHATIKTRGFHSTGKVGSWTAQA